MSSIRIRTVVVSMLIAAMPFGGMRVICLDAPAVPASSSGATDTRSDCERLCPLHETSDSSNDGPRCVLSADGSSLIVSAGVAVVRAQEPPYVPLVTAAVYAESPRFLPEPELPRFGPPPKPHAL